MVFTKRFFILFALGLIPIALTHFYRNTFEISLLYDGSIGLLLLLDFLLTPKPKTLVVKRSCEDKLSIGVENKITVTVRNKTNQKMLVTIKDEYPEDFEADNYLFSLEVAAFSQNEGSYMVKPFARGDYTFTAINVRYASRLGLYRRQFKVNDYTQIKVYPNLSEIKKSDLNRRRSQLMDLGLKASFFKGNSTNFESLREYVSDDEFRRINWKATARRGKLISNEYEMEKSQNILLVIDTARLMQTQINGRSKLDYAIDAALMLGHVGIEKDDKVGLLTFAEDIRTYLPPRKGRKQLYAILDSLYNTTPALEEANFAKVIRYLALKNRKRSLVCVFTDLIDPEISANLLRYLGTLVPEHLPLCISIRDPETFELADKNPDTGWEACQKAVAGQIIADREKTANVLRRRGIPVVDTTPENLSSALVNKYLELKKKALL